MGADRTDAADREQLSRGEIVAAAIALADEEGLDALSMRRLADRLGVSAMGLYRHIENKTDLLDAMVDTLVERAVVVADDQPGKPVERIVGVAVRLRHQMLEHPNLVPMVTTRPVGRQILGRSMAEVADVLGEAGVAPSRSVDAFAALASYVIGFLVYETTNGVAADPITPTGNETTGSASHDEQFEYGLRALLAGLATAPGR